MDQQSVLAIVTAVVGLLGGMIAALFAYRGKKDESATAAAIAQTQAHTSEMSAQLQAQSVLVTEKSKLESVYVSELSKRLDRFEDRAQESEKRWQQRISDLEKALDLANQHNDTLIGKLAELNAEVKFLTAKLAQSEADYAKQSALYELAIKQRDDYQAQLEAAKLRITALELEVARLGGK